MLLVFARTPAEEASAGAENEKEKKDVNFTFTGDVKRTIKT